jgi:hypothetical protein
MPEKNVDGDAIFMKAVMTVSRSDTPRDGGAAIQALCDWIQDRILDGYKYVSLVDTENTTFMLTVSVWHEDKNKFRAVVADMNSTDCWGESFEDMGEEFVTWIRENIHGLWS